MTSAEDFARLVAIKRVSLEISTLPRFASRPALRRRNRCRRSPGTVPGGGMRT